MKKWASIIITISLFIMSAQAQAPAVGTWWIVKHVRFPIPSDGVIAGPYSDLMSCSQAMSYYLANSQWFTTYNCELRAQ